ncbi:GNAT family protein [Rhodoblastus sp.]|jgi:RimJ/RimL family protein N-acetyltransferase|uniref:GNAT family N-acetyltransferase n=1 Tax=Rhodoblastus sp. TaxID=1962975 RepID=UPI0025EBFC1A|nr:GNAT family protein [Rhodoblastus sp.]
MELLAWHGAQRPERVTLRGRYARLEPLSLARHGEQLFASALEPGADDRFRYLPDGTPADYSSFGVWMEKSEASADPMFCAVIDMRTGRAEGRQALMRIDATNGVVEFGNILWGPAIARSRISTEALFLAAEYVFDTLGFRRFEWKCNDRNEPSKRAAERFGFVFEGVFRKHMVVKGLNRDTAWYAMTDDDWKAVKPAYLAWLDPDNFDAQGQQRTMLKTAARAG